MTESQLLAILISVCALTYSFEIVFGLAGTIMMLPIMGFFMDSKTLVIYSLLPQILTTVIALSKSYKKSNLRIFFSMMAFAAVGGVLGGYFFVQIPQDLFRRLLALVIVMAGIFLIVSPNFRINATGNRILDFSAGLSHSLFGISGPIVMTRLLGTFDDKTLIRNNALMFFCGLNSIRAVYYFVNGAITPDIQKMYLVSAFFLIPILFFAERLHVRINDVIFKRVVAWIILFCGIIYLIK